MARRFRPGLDYTVAHAGTLPENQHHDDDNDNDNDENGNGMTDASASSSSSSSSFALLDATLCFVK